MQWRKCGLMVLISICLISSLIGIAAASALLEEDIWGTVFDKHGSIMLLVDVESGRIINANQAAANFYGYSVAELQSMSIQ